MKVMSHEKRYDKPRKRVYRCVTTRMGNEKRKKTCTSCRFYSLKRNERSSGVSLPRAESGSVDSAASVIASFLS